MAIPDCKMGAIDPSILPRRWKVGCERTVHGFSRYSPGGISQPHAESSAVTARIPAMAEAKSDSACGSSRRTPRAEGR